MIANQGALVWWDEAPILRSRMQAHALFGFGPGQRTPKGNMCLSPLASISPLSYHPGGPMLRRFHEPLTS
jgi:hypothetical protein